MTVEELRLMLLDCGAEAEVYLSDVYGGVGDNPVTGMVYDNDTVTLTNENKS